MVMSGVPTLSRKDWKKHGLRQGRNDPFLEEQTVALRKLLDSTKSYFCHAINNLPAFLVYKLGLKINCGSGYRKCPLIQSCADLLTVEKVTKKCVHTGGM